MVNALKMQINSEKVLVEVTNLLQLIKEVRAQVLVHDNEQIRNENKEKIKMICLANKQSVV